MITFEQQGNFKKLNSFLERTLESIDLGLLNKYGREGVRALEHFTPKNTGLLASSWSYEIERDQNSVSIIWSNDDVEHGVNVAIMVQYGHATKNGKYIQGVDFINPALEPIFEELADKVWKGVTNQ